MREACSTSRREKNEYMGFWGEDFKGREVLEDSGIDGGSY